MLVVSIAYTKILHKILDEDVYAPPDFVAGHSLGEYTALITGNVLSFKDTLLLVQERGRLMQREVERVVGGMAAIIKMDREPLEEICAESGTEIANINSPGQIVISGSKEALSKAMDLAKSRGALRAIPLKVAGAFHSNLMDNATKELSDFIYSLPFQDASIPIVGNTSANILTKSRYITTLVINKFTK
ncbi:MAG: ACP S-malonyltransferase, partial [Dehalococcoidia bacterium]|nr:ACP S-malonyltransferase [Dehalococcoidia bacterium]